MCYRTGIYTVRTARPCISQPKIFKGLGSEGVKAKRTQTEATSHYNSQTTVRQQLNGNKFVKKIFTFFLADILVSGFVYTVVGLRLAVILVSNIFLYFICNGVEWSKDKTQAAESIKWRPQQAYGSNQFLLVQPQTVFSTHPKSSRSRIDKRTARATGNTRYRYSKIAPLDHKMADNCVSLARTNTLSSTITKLIKTSKTSNKSYSYNLLNRINKMYTHDLFYLHKEWEAWLAPVYIQIRTTKSQLTQCTKYKCH